MNNFRARKTKSKRKRIIFFLFLLITPILGWAGYIFLVQPQNKIKNYASITLLTVIGVETKLNQFNSTETVNKRIACLDVIERLQGQFYAAECPDGNISFELQWKTAKIFEYALIYMTMQIGGEYTEEEATEAMATIQNRLDDAKWRAENLIGIHDSLPIIIYIELNKKIRGIIN